LDEISFLDIFKAVEGEEPFFKDHKIRNNIKINNKEDFICKANKTLAVFQDAEMKYKDTLSKFTIKDLLQYGIPDILPMHCNKLVNGDNS
jgi:DNA-binding IscR family transcriptional regulator